MKIPWYAVFGNHDDSIQGTLPSDWGLLKTMYTSDRKITGFASDNDTKAYLQAAQGNGPVALSNDAASLTRQITADERRVPFTPSNSSRLICVTASMVRARTVMVSARMTSMPCAVTTPSRLPTA